MGDLHWNTPIVALRVDQEVVDHAGSLSPIVYALEAWRGYSGVPELRVLSSNSDRVAQGRVSWGGGPSPGDTELATTEVAFTTSTQELLTFRVYVRDDVRWYFGSQQTPAGMYDFESVLTHEFGHALGLEHDVLDGNVMYRYLSSGVNRRMLTDRDESQLEYLYSGPRAQRQNVASERDYGCSVARVHAASGCALAALIVIGLAVRTARRKIRKRPRRRRLLALSPGRLSFTLALAVAFRAVF